MSAGWKSYNDMGEALVLTIKYIKILYLKRFFIFLLIKKKYIVKYNEFKKLKFIRRCRSFC